MTDYFSAAIGGMIGAMLRFAVSRLALARWGGDFPWGTLLVNVAGSFLIGLCWQLFERWELAPAARLFLFVGIFGAFTTFSSFSLEGLQLFQAGRVQAGLVYVVGSNLLGLTAVFLGYLLGQFVSGN
ncbi:MAG: fluoride efflux transporter CrcB [Chloroflexota bacterium]